MTKTEGTRASQSSRVLGVGYDLAKVPSHLTV